jgi:hypothetical protein
MVLLMVISVVGTINAAETRAVDRTNGDWNGNYWTSMNETGRLHFIIGFCEGSWAFYDNLYSQINFQKTKNLMETINKEYHSQGTTFGSIVDFLNKFYSTTQYKIIPIHIALRCFHLSTNGKITVKQIDDFATEVLKFYAENPPEMT